jgi:hypothetical protein
MGAIALHCAALRIDQGWLRILGAGSPLFGSGLREWNAGLGGQALGPPRVGALVVAYDALGGFFAINGGQWTEHLGGTYYLSPDAGGWQSLGMGYSGLVEWSMSAALDPFYEPYRWAGWEAEVAGLGQDQALSIYPPLGFDPMPISERRRGAVPARELWTFHHELAREGF